MKELLRILRYNTGTDKKAFVELKEQFDAVVFNATIVAYSGSSVADLVSMHERKYIIDPQTHIFQQDISAIMATNGKAEDVEHIKKSVDKYLDQLPKSLAKILREQQRPLNVPEIMSDIDDLVAKTYEFQTEYVSKYIKKKDYDKYLEFTDLQPSPRMVIAPYFMLKGSYSKDAISSWLHLNSECLRKTIEMESKSEEHHPIAAQLVLDKTVLELPNFADEVKKTYSSGGYEYIFIWIDDFDAFATSIDHVQAFADLIKKLNGIGKKPIMAYGGYESIILCNAESPVRLYGVAQSVGYGEYRAITPVGGGLPVNKYYFLPLHRRLKFGDAATILSAHGYFTGSKSPADRARDYYAHICDCRQCHHVIHNDIHNFNRYSDSSPYDVHTRNGIVKRNKPTYEAEVSAALHFLYCKVQEWESVEKQGFVDLVHELRGNYKKYCPEKLSQIDKWCKVYGYKKN